MRGFTEAMRMIAHCACHICIIRPRMGMGGLTAEASAGLATDFSDQRIITMIAGEGAGNDAKALQRNLVLAFAIP